LTSLSVKRTSKQFIVKTHKKPLQHSEVQQVIQQEDKKVKAWNNYTKRVNQNMGAGLKYKKNRYTGRNAAAIVMVMNILSDFMEIYGRGDYYKSQI